MAAMPGDLVEELAATQVVAVTEAAVVGRPDQVALGIVAHVGQINVEIHEGRAALGGGMKSGEAHTAPSRTVGTGGSEGAVGR